MSISYTFFDIRVLPLHNVSAGECLTVRSLSVSIRQLKSEATYASQVVYEHKF